MNLVDGISIYSSNSQQESDKHMVHYCTTPLKYRLLGEPLWLLKIKEQHINMSIGLLLHVIPLFLSPPSHMSNKGKIPKKKRVWKDDHFDIKHSTPV